MRHSSQQQSRCVHGAYGTARTARTRAVRRWGQTPLRQVRLHNPVGSDFGARESNAAWSRRGRIGGVRLNVHGQRLNRGRRPYTFRRDFPRCRPCWGTAIAHGRRVTFRIALFWIAALCCVVAELAILRSVFFGRAATGRRSREEAGASSSANRGAELAWVLLPAAGLLLILYLTWRAVDPIPAPIRDVSHGGAIIGA